MIRKRIILTVACLAIFFEALDVSVLNMAIPQMEEYFDFGADAIQWVQTVYVLFFGGFVLLGGRLADTIGRKRIFLSGAILFVLASLGAGLSPQFGWLLACRALQGAGAALAIPSAISIITHTFTEETERQRGLAIFGAMAGIGFATGLAIGGLISSYAGWQWVFFINIPVIGTAILLALRFIPADERPEQRQPSNALSGVLITLLMMMAAWLVHKLGDIGREPVLFITLLVAFFFLGYIFLRRERVHPLPLVDFRIFSLDGVMTGNAGAMLLGTVFLSYLFLLSLYLQHELHFSAMQAGLLLFPFSILSGIISKFVLPGFFARFGVVKTGMIGTGFLLVGVLFFLLSIYTQLPVVFILCAVLCCNALGISITFPCMTILAVQSVPAHHQGLAAGVNVTFNSFGGGLGLSLVTLVLHLNGDTGGKMYAAGLIVIALLAVAGVGQLWLYQRRHQRVVTAME